MVDKLVKITLITLLNILIFVCFIGCNDKEYNAPPFKAKPNSNVNNDNNYSTTNECSKIGIDSSCNQGEACYPAEDKYICLEAGDKNAGEPCNAINDCVAGVACIDTGDGYLCWKVCSDNSDCNGGTCTDTQLGYSLCSEYGDPCQGKKAGDTCQGGYCIEFNNGGLECKSECPKVGSNESCGNNESCYPINNYKICLLSGTKEAGEVCEVPNDCVAGATCIDAGDGYLCWKVCSDNSDCNGGTCTDTQLGYSVCVYQ